MRYELFISLRYLRAKRKEAFISLITVFSTLGVAIGVMVLNIVLSVMTGFEEDLRDRILGFNPHILVTSFGGTVKDYPALMEQLQDVPGVVRAVPFVYGQVMLSTGQSVSGVLVRGVLPYKGATAELEEQLEGGSIEQLAERHAVPIDEGRSGTVELPGIILGKELATQLDVGIGDPITLISPIGTPSAVGLVPHVKRFVVVALFNSGMTEYDTGLVYVGLTDAQRFFRLEDTVTGLEVRVSDMYQADRLANRIGDMLGFPFRVRDWMEMNHNLFSALKLEKTVYFIVLLLIILVAAFNIVATLIMVVMEKRKDIAILKSMGASPAGIGRIFVLKGLIIGLVGTLLGSIGGYAGCIAVSKYPIPLPQGVFYVSTVPVKMYGEYFALVGFASLFICLVATIYPSRQAARLAPVDVIRYE